MTHRVNIHKVETENRLFLRILTGMMATYFTMVVILIGKADTQKRVRVIKNSNRFTRLIVKLPVAPKKVIKEKEKKVIKTEAKKKKITPEKKKKVIPRVGKKKKKIKAVTVVKKDVANLGVLKLLGSVESSVGGIDSLEETEMVSLNKFSTEPDDNGEDFFNNTETASYFEETDTINEDSEEIIKDLNLQYNKKHSPKLTISKNYSRPVDGTFEKEVDKDMLRNPEFIEKKVEEYAAGIRFCYNSRLGMNEKPKGKILINFTILSSGKTQGVEIKSNEITDTHLKDCIISAVTRWKFPASGEEKILVTYPLLLSTEKT